MVVGTIWNGEKGKNGAGCSVNDEGDGTMTVTCGEGVDATTETLYKAMCGTNPYDPAKSFCSEGEVYELCDGKTYDPKKQYCKLAATVENYGWLEDARDEQHIQIYKTVEICNDGETSCQTWMAENLNYSVDPGERSWCGGGEKNKVSEGDCSKYGRLYTWTAAVGKTEDECGYGKVCDLPSGNVSGVCPEGWHLPSDDEWNTLFIAAGGIGIAGQKLKSNTNLWKQEEGISNDDSFGFAALPAGYRYYGEIFYEEGEKAYFWSSTEFNAYFACYWIFSYSKNFVGYNEFNKGLALSVRCVKN